MELRELAELFARQDTAIVAISQEDDDLAKAARMHGSVGGGELPLDLAFDIEREVTDAWDRTTAYLVDTDGVVQEIFPMIIHARPSGVILLGEAMQLVRRREAAAREAEAEAEAAGEG